MIKKTRTVFKTVRVSWSFETTMRLSTNIFFVLFLLPTPAFSQNEDKLVNIRNAGSFKCAQLLPVISQPGRQVEKTAFLNWIAAYATAASRSNSLIDVFPLGDTWEFLIMVSLVCSENEEANFETAVRVSLRRLQAFWIKGSPNFLELNDPQGRTIQLYSEAVRPLQSALNRYGANIDVDGTYGNKTGNAILQLNKARNAKNWMTPDGELLYQITRPSN